MSGKERGVGCLPPVPSKAAMEILYGKYNRREFVHPDPLEFLYQYDNPVDREVVGLVASSLAYGRVRQILNSVSTVLERMGRSPSSFLQVNSDKRLRSVFSGFKHRFTTDEDMVGLLGGLRMVLRSYGSVQVCFMRGFQSTDSTVIPALTAFVRELKRGCPGGCGTLLPSPVDGSACKRLHLFLRWMVRKDAIDPGGWPRVLRRRLVVPLDTHMHKIGLTMGLTSRKQADMRTALEITDRFRSIAPEDPVRYDFALTRLGIRDSIDV